MSYLCYIAYFIIRALSWLSKDTYAQKAYTLFLIISFIKNKKETWVS